MRLLLCVVLLVGCYDPEVPLGVPCSETGECPAGQQCDAITNTCTGPTDLQVWRDDTAADFAQPGAVLTDATIEPLGAIGPAPYATGRFKLAGIAADMIPDPSTAPWDAIAAAPITGVAYTPRLEMNYSADIPDGLGLTTGDNITVTVEGELYLDATGMWIFELDANDKGFVEIAPPGGDFVRVVTSSRAVTTGTFVVTTPGWHRVRGAFADAAMNMDFTLRLDAPNVAGGQRSIKSDQMRVRVDDMTGWAIDGFADGLLVDYTGSTLQQDPIDGDYNADPFGILLGAGAWSMRWSGQVLFDATGDYVFHIASLRGHRMWIDGNLIADAFVNLDQQTTTAPIHLDEGWHDVVIDLTKSGASSTTPSMLSVHVMDGPVWVGQSIPTDHVRPLIGRQVRWASDQNGTDVAVPDGSSATKPLFIDLPANAVPMSIQAGSEIDHPAQAQMSVVLDPPVGANLTFLAFGGLTGTGVRYGYDAVPRRGRWLGLDVHRGRQRGRHRGRQPDVRRRDDRAVRRHRAVPDRMAVRVGRARPRRRHLVRHAALQAAARRRHHGCRLAAHVRHGRCVRERAVDRDPNDASPTCRSAGSRSTPSR